MGQVPCPSYVSRGRPRLFLYPSRREVGSGQAAGSEGGSTRAVDAAARQTSDIRTRHPPRPASGSVGPPESDETLDARLLVAHPPVSGSVPSLPTGGTVRISRVFLTAVTSVPHFRLCPLKVLSAQHFGQVGERSENPMRPAVLQFTDKAL